VECWDDDAKAWLQQRNAELQPRAGSAVGSVSSQVQHWAAIGTPQVVMEWLHGGITLRFIQEVPRVTWAPLPHYKNWKEFIFLSNYVLTGVDEGAFELVGWGSPMQVPLTIHHAEPIFAVPKIGPKLYRGVYDLRGLNQYLPDRAFKMDGLGTFIRMTCKEAWMASSDLVDGYWQVLMAPESRKYLGFWFRGAWFRHRVLPMGLKLAPWFFTKIMRAPIKWLRSQGCRIMAYLDDLALTARTLQELLHWREVLATLMDRLGLRRSLTKGHWMPTQQLPLLGLIVNTVAGTVEIPEAKMIKLEAALRALLAKSHPTARHLARVAGLLTSVSRAFQPAALMTRSLFGIINAAKRRTWQWDWTTALTIEALQDLQWVQEHLREWNGRPAWKPSRVLSFYTDASEMGYGLYIPDLQIQTGLEMLPHHRGESSGMREIRAVVHGLEIAGERLRGRRLRLHTDNPMCRSYFDRSGGSDPRATALVRQVFHQLCQLDALLVDAWWLPGWANEVADFQSRLVDLGDWMLDNEVFRYLDHLWGPHTCDLFASTANAKVAKFYSWRLVQDTQAVDAFTQDWHTDNNLAVVPFALVDRVLEHAVECQAHLTLVVPVWPAAAWWPLLREMTVAAVELMPQAFLPGPSGVVEPHKQPLWRFLAVRVSPQNAGQQCVPDQSVLDSWAQ
jgi:hypothetical protein